ncbi:transglutaminase domain-containing protein [Cellulomonas persica]|uniref:Transglutaminase n=1 Tax=Cellulomonas persica TaxID=76861 RepID=A0A510UT17_9CELL|nr:transglutaminase domain-containing protein [Cellulomonas persica]GEK17808.1 transglutaminase [Cellulomonas persica]
MTATLDRAAPARAAQAPVRTRAAARARRRPLALGLVDATVLVAVLALVLAPLLEVYGGNAALPAIAGGLLLGAGLALVGAWRRWTALTVVAAALVTYGLVGGPLAAPTTTVAGVVPTADTVLGLARGAVTSWAQVVTLQPPVGSGGTLLVAALLLAFVGSLSAVAVAVRAPGRWAAAAALVPVGVLVVVILLGVRFPLVPPVWTGVVLGAVLLPWAAWRAGGLRPRRVVALATLALVGVASAFGGAPLVLDDEPRYVLRDEIVPPFDPRDYASPLSGFREYVKRLDETTLFTVEGLGQGGRVRLATMDRYDGVVWNVAGDGSAQSSGEFRRVGDELPASVRGERRTVRITIDALTGVWLPTVGHATGFDLGRTAPQLRFNDATGAAVLTGGLRSGLTYELETIVPAVPTVDEIGTAAAADVLQPDLAGVPEVVGVTAADVAREAGHAVEVADAIASWLIEEGYYSDGLDGQTASLSGHGADRIASLLADDLMIGDGEQYAAAMALMVRSLGLPARVVLGFVPSAEDVASGEPVAVTGADVQAWVEVAFSGHGWVPFDATPPKEKTPDKSDAPEQSDPKPQVVQPPPPPPGAVTPPDDDTEQPAPEPPAQEDDSAALWRRVALLTVAFGVPAILLASPFIVVGVIKAGRRRRRRRRGDAVTRVAGGWDEVLDEATDLRRPVPATATRSESARVLALAFAGDPASRRRASSDRVVQQVDTLARHADRVVFGPGEPDATQVAQYWSQVDSTLATMRASVSWRQRLRTRLSLASVRARRRTRKDVAPATRPVRSGSTRRRSQQVSRKESR